MLFESYSNSSHQQWPCYCCISFSRFLRLYLLSFACRTAKFHFILHRTFSANLIFGNHLYRRSSRILFSSTGRRRSGSSKKKAAKQLRTLYEIEQFRLSNNLHIKPSESLFRNAYLLWL